MTETRDEFDPYKPGTGLKDDFNGWIKDGVFASEQYGTNIILMVECDDGEEYPVRYSVGGGWDTYDAGETVSHPAGSRQLFNSSSAYSDFMTFAIEAGAKELLYQRAKDGLGPRHASNYNGLEFHWEQVDRPVRRPKVDEQGGRVKDDRGREIWENSTAPRLLPVRFIGLHTEQQTLLPEIPTPTEPANGTDPLRGLDAVTAAKVRQAAKRSGDYITFVDEMLELTDGADNSIMDHDEIKEALADESWYAALHNA